MNLHLHVRKKYFLEILSGEKKEEYRLDNPYWRKRLSSPIDLIIIYNGYPKKDDSENILLKPWRSMRETKVIHPEFGDKIVQVFAIRVND